MRKILVLSTVLGCLAASAASAYTLLTPARTVGAPVVVFVDAQGLASVTDGDGGVSAVVAAIQSAQGWNGAGAGILLEAQAANVSSMGPGDGISTIFFSDPFGACTGSCIVSTLGPTLSQRPDGSYEAVEMDIVVNPAFAWTSVAEPGACSGEIHIESVVVRSLGRLLGLGSSSVPGATMYPSLSACNNGAATIADDDAAGILDLYGAAPCTGCERYEDYLAPAGSAIPGSTYFSTSGGTIEAWLEGTESTLFYLTLYKWTGTGWAPVATSPTGSPLHLAYSGSAGYYYWRISSDPHHKPGRYFFYQKLP